MLAWLKRVLFLLIVIVAFLFAALAVNQDEIALHFAVWRTPVELSVFWWLLISFALGLSFGVVGALVMRITYGLRARALQRELARRNEEIAELQAAAVTNRLDQAAALPAPAETPAVVAGPG